VSRPRILDPQAVPVIGTDAHLPAVDHARLTPEALRQRFVLPPSWQAEIPGDTGSIEQQLMPASVLVPLVQRPEGLKVLLTRRTDHLRDHAGQISFPGGRVEPADASLAHAALREATEEVGLPAERVAVLGELAHYETVTGYRVTPIVGWVEPPFVLAPDPVEVADVFEVPLAFLLDPENQQRHFRMLGEVRRDFWAIPYGDRYIWGATAAMLMILDRTLRAGPG